MTPAMGHLDDRERGALETTMNTSQTEFSLDVRLPPHPTIVASVRRCLDGLAPFLRSDLFDNVRLLVNELVTNSIRHAGVLLGSEWILLRVTAMPALVRVEVCDPGPGFVPEVGAPSVERPSGRGLYLVDKLADRWGVSNEGTTCVWFEIDAA